MTFRVVADATASRGNLPPGNAEMSRLLCLGLRHQGDSAEAVVESVLDFVTM